MKIVLVRETQNSLRVCVYGMVCNDRTPSMSPGVDESPLMTWCEQNDTGVFVLNFIGRPEPVLVKHRFVSNRQSH